MKTYRSAVSTSRSSPAMFQSSDPTKMKSRTRCKPGFKLSLFISNSRDSIRNSGSRRKRSSKFNKGYTKVFPSCPEHINRNYSAISENIIFRQRKWPRRCTVLAFIHTGCKYCILQHVGSPSCQKWVKLKLRKQNKRTRTRLK